MASNRLDQYWKVSTRNGNNHNVFLQREVHVDLDATQVHEVAQIIHSGWMFNVKSQDILAGVDSYLLDFVRHQGLELC